nr:hypothetical protein [Candidatus Sigynarchaeota archaeon]
MHGAKKTCPEADRAYFKPRVEELMPPRKAAPLNRMFCMAISSDGRQLAAAGEDGRIFLWSPGQRAAPATLVAEGASVEKLLFFSSGERLLAFAGDGSFAAWDTTRFQVVNRVANAHGKGIYSACIDDRQQLLVTGGLDGWICGWDMDRFSKRFEVNSPKHGVLALLPVNDSDQSYLYSGNANGSINVFDISSQKRLYSVQAHDGPVFTLKRLPIPDSIVSAGNDGVIKVWKGGIQDLAWKIQSGQGKVLDVLVLEPAARQMKHSGNNEAVIFGTAGGDGTIKIWKLERSLREYCLVATLTAHDRTVEQLVLDPSGGDFFSLASSGSLKRWSF